MRGRGFVDAGCLLFVMGAFGFQPARTMAQQTTTVEPTEWVTLADPSLYHYEWYDPAKLTTLKAWVNWASPYDNSSWDAGPPSGLTKQYPLVARDANGVWRPQGPNFYPQEEYTQIMYPVWTPVTPKAGNLIDDPGHFQGVYDVFSPRWDEMWRFNNAHHLYSAYAREAAAGFAHPSTFLPAGDLVIYNDYAKKRDRLQTLRAQYFAIMRQTFDKYDYDRILDGLKNTPAGGTLELGAGDFYYHRALSNADTIPGMTAEIVLWEFAGNVIRGQGSGVTRLRTLPGATIEWGPNQDWYQSFNLSYRGEAGLPPADVTVGGLTVIVDEPMKEWIHHGVPANYHPQGIQISANDREVHGTWADVQVIAARNDRYYGLDWLSGRSILFGLQEVRFRNGSIVHRRVEVKGAGIPLMLLFLTGTNVTVGGGPEEGCLFRDTVSGVAPFFTHGCTVELSHNRTENAPLLSMDWEEPGEPNAYLASYNEIFLEGSAWSPFELWGVPGRDTKIVLSQNTIISPSHLAPFGPVFSFANNNGLLANNKVIGGGGPFAFYLLTEWPFQVPATGWVLVGNNLQRFNTAVAGTILDVETSACTVVGNAKHTVLDLGTGNWLTGVTKVPGSPPGPAIREAMERKRQILDSLGKW